MIEHFYQSIHGWFNYEHVYRSMVEQIEDEALFVEIGSFKGRSTAYMAVEIANSGKRIKFDCVDPMKPLGHYEQSSKNEPHEWDGYSVDEFHKRLESVKSYYNLVQLTSDEAVKLYQDKSIDFLLIDGDHSYEGVKNDVINWIPKMRPGGLIVGDDAYASDVKNGAIDGAAKYGLNVYVPDVHFYIEIPE